MFWDDDDDDKTVHGDEPVADPGESYQDQDQRIGGKSDPEGEQSIR